jgi:NAD(P)H-hydrate epimerase
MPLTREQAREFDRRAIEEYGVPSTLLMENAGRGVAVHVRRVNPKKRRTIICCGGGNNGGDGFVVARHLDNFGWPVKVLLFAKPSSLKGDAATMFEILKRSQVLLDYVPLDSVRVEDYLNEELTNFNDGWIIDALFGTGLSGEVREPFDRVIAAINSSPAPVLAVDIPSGLDCDTGQPLGSAARANFTVTFAGMKKGFLVADAIEWTGEVHVVDIGAPRVLLSQFPLADDPQIIRLPDPEPPLNGHAP